MRRRLPTIPDKCPLVTALLGDGSGVKMSFVEKLLTRQVVRVKKSDRDLRAPWPATTLLAALVGDVFANHTALKTVRSELTAAGLPLQAWLIGVNGRLFNTLGEETYEPIFTADYLCELVNAMWELGASVFGTRYFTYKNLADKVYEDQVLKVKAAARRISVISQSASIPGYENRAIIWSSEGGWLWSRPTDLGRNDLQAGKVELSQIVSLGVQESLKSYIMSLGKPGGE